MKVALIGEGQTEFTCLPKLAGRLGNAVVGRARTITVSSDFDWRLFFEKRVVPLVFAMLTNAPDKIVIVLDREDRDECPADLATMGLEVITTHCGYCLGDCTIAVVISNRKFESLLFADYAAVDSLPILKHPISHTFSATTDATSVVTWITPALEEGCAFDKVQHGAILAKRMNLDDPRVQQRSRSLRKLIKELTPPNPGLFDRVADAPLDL
jgi:hypothetical protein